MILGMISQGTRTAPAMVVLAHGSRDPRSAATIQAIVTAARALRPHVRVEAAFLDLSAPLFPVVVADLVDAGCDAIVVVPLLLTEAFHATTDVPLAIATASEKHTHLTISASNILGLDPAFLDVLDRRLDGALRDASAPAPDALVLAAAGSSNPSANQAVAEFARQWGIGRNLPVTAAYAAGTAPTTGAAVRALQAEGHRNIAVGSLFLAPGRLPDRAAKLALEAGAIAMAAPMGAATEIARAILDRYGEVAG